MFFDVPARKLHEMRTLAQTDLLRFGLGVFDLPAVAQDSPDHPESADANRAGAVDERRPVFRVVSDLQKLIDLFVLRIAKRDRDIEVAQAQLLRLRFLFGGAMLARLAQVDDGLHAFGLQLLKVFKLRLSAGAEVFIDAQEISDRRQVVLGHSRSDPKQDCKKDVQDFHARHLTLSPRLYCHSFVPMSTLTITGEFASSIVSHVRGRSMSSAR